MNTRDRLFTNKMILYFIIPIAVEQILFDLLDIADDIMVSHLGEDVLSGLSLAGRINCVIYGLFMGFVLGGMIIVAQLLGRRDTESARKISYTLLSSLTLISVLVSLVVAFFSDNIISMLYEEINKQTHNSATIYLNIVGLSYPSEVIYYCCSNLFRMMKDSKTPTIVSVVMNIINVILNYIFIFKFDIGIVGAALGTLISRYITTLTIFALLCNKKRDIYFELDIKKYRIDFTYLRQILSFGIPTATDKGMFQLGRLMIASIFSAFGSMQMAANVVFSGVDTIMEILPDAVCTASTTIIGHCAGIGDIEQIKYYTKKLMIIGMLLALVTLPITLLSLPILHTLYSVTEETWSLAMKMSSIVYMAVLLFYAPSFTLAYILRAVGDVKFVMFISIFCMWVFRLGGSFILAKCLGLGIIGTSIAIFMDWMIRSIILAIRYKSGKWKKMVLLSKV